MKQLTKVFSNRYLVTIVHFLAVVAFAQTSSESSDYCAGAYGLKQVFCTVLNSFDNIADLIGGFAYVMGMGFGVAAVLKFKQHRDAPTQVQIGHPLMYLTTSVGLIYFPSLITESAESVFSSGINESYQKAFVDPDVWTGS